MRHLVHHYLQLKLPIALSEPMHLQLQLPFPSAAEQLDLPIARSVSCKLVRIGAMTPSGSPSLEGRRPFRVNLRPAAARGTARGNSFVNGACCGAVSERDERAYPLQPRQARLARRHSWMTGVHTGNAHPRHEREPLRQHGEARGVGAWCNGNGPRVEHDHHKRCTEVYQHTVARQSIRSASNEDCACHWVAVSAYECRRTLGAVCTAVTDTHPRVPKLQAQTEPSRPRPTRKSKPPTPNRSQ